MTTINGNISPSVQLNNSLISHPTTPPQLQNNQENLMALAISSVLRSSESLECAPCRMKIPNGYVGSSWVFPDSFSDEQIKKVISEVAAKISEMSHLNILHGVVA